MDESGEKMKNGLCVSILLFVIVSSRSKFIDIYILVIEPHCSNCGTRSGWGSLKMSIESHEPIKAMGYRIICYATEGRQEEEVIIPRLKLHA